MLQDSPKLAPYRVKMGQLKIGQTMVIPWSAFTSGQPKTRKERSMSDGNMVWVCTPNTYGIEVRRIE